MKVSGALSIASVVSFGIAWLSYVFLFPPSWQHGGALTVLTLGLSILVPALAFERLMLYQRRIGRAESLSLLRGVSDRLQAGDVEGALVYTQETEGALATVIAAALRAGTELPHGRVAYRMRLVRNAADNALSLERPILRQNLNLLNTIGAVAIPLGILGFLVTLTQVLARPMDAGVIDPFVFATEVGGTLVPAIIGVVAALEARIAHAYLYARFEESIAGIRQAVGALLPFIVKPAARAELL